MNHYEQCTLLNAQEKLYPIKLMVLRCFVDGKPIEE